MLFELPSDSVLGCKQADVKKIKNRSHMQVQGYEFVALTGSETS